MPLKIKIRILLFVILFAVAFRLLWMNIIPSGRATYANNFKNDNFFISDFFPAERFELNESGRLIIADPVYFSLYTPRTFNKADVYITYKMIGGDEKSADNEIIEAGVLVDKNIWRYNLKPVENKIINQLMLVWDVKRDNDGLILLQREKKYDSIADFFSNPPDSSEIALYNYDFKEDFLIDGYAGSDRDVVLNVPLRGSYQFYTYIKDEDLSFDLEFIDLNQNKDADPVDINLYFQNQIIASRHLDDDGEVKESGLITDLRNLEFTEKELPEGVYKIELRANDDIVTERIKTRQTKLSFAGSFYLSKTDSYNEISLFTDGKTAQFKTVFPDSLQDVGIGGDILRIDKTYTQFDVKTNRATSSNFTEIKLQKSGVILAGDGMFAFSEDALFNPKFKKVDANININQDGVNYVLTHYRESVPDDGWKNAKLEFDLNGAYREDGVISFLLSAPHLKLDDGKNNGILIKEIKFDLFGVGLVEKLKKIINEKF